MNKNISREQFVAQAHRVYDRYEKAAALTVPPIRKDRASGFDELIVQLMSDQSAEKFLHDLRTTEKDWSRFSSTQLVQIVEILDEKTDQIIAGMCKGMDGYAAMYEEICEQWEACIKRLPPDARREVARRAQSHFQAFEPHE